MLLWMAWMDGVVPSSVCAAVWPWRKNDDEVEVEADGWNDALPAAMAALEGPDVRFRPAEIRHVIEALEAGSENGLGLEAASEPRTPEESARLRRMLWAFPAIGGPMPVLRVSRGSYLHQALVLPRLSADARTFYARRGALPWLVAASLPGRITAADCRAMLPAALEDLRASYRPLRVALLAVRLRWERLAFRKWRVWTAVQRALEDELKDRLARRPPPLRSPALPDKWGPEHLARAVTVWRGGYYRFRRMQLFAEAFCDVYRRAHLRIAVERWRRFVLWYRWFERGTVVAYRAWWRRSLLRHLFRRWDAYRHWRLRAKAALLRALIARRRRQLRQAYRRWRRHTGLLAATLLFARRFRQGSTVWRWRQFARWHRALRILWDLLSRARREHLFRLWRTHARRRRGMRLLLNRLFPALRRILLADFWRRWRLLPPRPAPLPPPPPPPVAQPELLPPPARPSFLGDDADAALAHILRVRMAWRTRATREGLGRVAWTYVMPDAARTTLLRKGVPVAEEDGEDEDQERRWQDSTARSSTVSASLLRSEDASRRGFSGTVGPFEVPFPARLHALDEAAGSRRGSESAGGGGGGGGAEVVGHGVLEPRRSRSPPRGPGWRDGDVGGFEFDDEARRGALAYRVPDRLVSSLRFSALDRSDVRRGEVDARATDVGSGVTSASFPATSRSEGGRSRSPPRGASPSRRTKGSSSPGRRAVPPASPLRSSEGANRKKLRTPSSSGAGAAHAGKRADTRSFGGSGIRPSPQPSSLRRSSDFDAFPPRVRSAWDGRGESRSRNPEAAESAAAATEASAAVGARRRATTNAKEEAAEEASVTMPVGVAPTVVHKAMERFEEDRAMAVLRSSAPWGFEDRRGMRREAHLVQRLAEAKALLLADQARDEEARLALRRKEGKRRP